MENSDAMRLIAAIFKRAVDDFQYLQNGGKESRDRNYAELEDFFLNECDVYLCTTDLKGKNIYEMLQYERVECVLT